MQKNDMPDLLHTCMMSSLRADGHTYHSHTTNEEEKASKRRSCWFTGCWDSKRTFQGKPDELLPLNNNEENSPGDDQDPETQWQGLKTTQPEPTTAVTEYKSQEYENNAGI